MTKTTEGSAHTCTEREVVDILANRQIQGKKRFILFRHNGDLAAGTHTNTHTHHTSAVSVSSRPIYLDDSERLGIPGERG